MYITLAPSGVTLNLGIKLEAVHQHWINLTIV